MNHSINQKHHYNNVISLTWCQNDAYVFWIVACTASVMHFSGFLTPPNAHQLFLCNLCLGLPHGATDIIRLKKLSQTTQKPLWLAIFIYCLVVSAAICFWIMQPTLALIIFLLISGVHFGQDWKKDNKIHGFILGMGLLSIPCLAQPTSCYQLFSLLTFGQSTVIFLHPLFMISLFSAMIIATYQLNQQPWIAFEFAALTLIGYLLDPLYFFTIYFCSLHSMRHIRRITESKLMKKQHIYPLIITIVCCMFLTAITHQSLSQYRPISIEKLIEFRTLFILLFALTVPHMLLESQK